MARSWRATGLLEAEWGKVGGRDRLAELTGIQPGTLSGYNTGRLRLGIRNAKRIAAALGVDVADLGAPAEEEAEHSSIAQRLRLVEGRVDIMMPLVEQLAAAKGAAKEFHQALARLQDGASDRDSQPASQPT